MSTYAILKWQLTDKPVELFAFESGLLPSKIGFDDGKSAKSVAFSIDFFAVLVIVIDF